jgi:hypothetical protein
MAVDITVMGFNIPELIVESIIRDGIQNVRNNPSIIDDVFTQLTRAYNSAKYGATEIAKIKTMMTAKEFPVVYSYSDVEAHNFCFSIVVGNDDEDKRRAHLNDDYGSETDFLVDPADIAALTVIPNIQPTAYDPISGKVSIPDSVDLTNAFRGLVYVDDQGTEHTIVGGIDNTPGQRNFFVPKQDEVSILAPGYIKSPLDYTVSEIRGVTSDIQLVIGVHAKDALTVKWLYILLKYFVLSRKFDLISRGIYVASYHGSDFNRNQEYLGDRVFTRFWTLTGKVDDTWRSDLVELIDRVIIDGTPVDGLPTED